MSPNRREEIISQFIDLEEYTEELFAMAAPAPTLSKQSQKTILKRTVGRTGWSLPKLSIMSTSVAFAAFAILVGFAQFSNAPGFLNRLRISQTVQRTPSTQEVQQVQKELSQQQSEIEKLQQTGAPQAEITKAVEVLDKTVSDSKKKGFDITKTVLDDGKIIIDVKASGSTSRHRDSDSLDSQLKQLESSDSTESSNSTTTSR